MNPLRKQPVLFLDSLIQSTNNVPLPSVGDASLIHTQSLTQTYKQTHVEHISYSGIFIS